MSDEQQDNPCPLPGGDYAIIECLGHRTLVGRYTEVEQFGTKLCAVEPIFNTGLLPEIYVGGASIYALTPCSREAAWRRRPKQTWVLPASLRATLTPAQLPAPKTDDVIDEDGGESDGIPF